MIRPALLVLTSALLTACSPLPELSGTVAPDTEQAEYLDLVPFDALTTQAADNATSETDMSARSAALRARAARLRGTVIDAGTRARMASGVPPR